MESSSSCSENPDTYDISLNEAETFLKSLTTIRQPNASTDGKTTNGDMIQTLAPNTLQGSFDIGLPSITLSNTRDDFCSNKSYKKPRDSNLCKRESVCKIFNIDTEEMRHSLCNTKQYTRNSFSHSQHSSIRLFTKKIFPFFSTSENQLDKQTIENLEAYVLKSKRRCGKKDISYKGLLCASSDFNSTVTINMSPVTKNFDSNQLDFLGISMVPVKDQKKNREQINKDYRKKFPWLHSTITLSKLRNLKHDLFNLIDKVSNLDPSTVAAAWFYFEQLLLKRVVHKGIRKILAAACLLLSYKFNQDLLDNQLSELIVAVQTLDRQDNLKAQDIFSMEFTVFALIEFNLQVPFSKIKSHLNEYLTSKNISLADQYGVAETELLAVSNFEMSHGNASQACGSDVET
ncbi:uncharacterized protein LOC128883832 isoform X2 [Hylaeus volcanicus]|uniref:uncharacterized protein LOC128883832 isoform X2 n=1 Tax=Hylaeus volcanicus TaxID=313075 RepID=UPI0023B7BA4E|nr:uncharacterized protein LOC128883832 isoform X2 [Hylaeus volcanicus]